MLDFAELKFDEVEPRGLLFGTHAGAIQLLAQRADADPGVGDSGSQGRECIAPECVLEEGLAGNPNAAVDAGEHSVDEAAVQSHAQEAEPALLGTAERTIAEQAND